MVALLGRSPAQDTALCSDPREANGKSKMKRTHTQTSQLVLSRLALAAIFMNLNLQFTTEALKTAASAVSPPKIISDQHRSAHALRSADSAARAERANTAPVRLAVSPQANDLSASATQFDDDDEEDDEQREQRRQRHEQSGAITYTLLPTRDDERVPTPRFHWSAPATRPADRGANATVGGKQFVNKDTRSRYKVQVQRTLNSTNYHDQQQQPQLEPQELVATLISATGPPLRAPRDGPDSERGEKCQKNIDSGESATKWRQNKKFLKSHAAQAGKHQRLFEPILVTSDVRVRSDLVLVRDHENEVGASRGQRANATQMSVKLDALGLPVRTLSERVQLPSQPVAEYPPEEPADEPENEKIFILTNNNGGGARSHARPPSSIKLHLNTAGDTPEDSDQQSGNLINGEDEEQQPGGVEELSRAGSIQLVAAAAEMRPYKPLKPTSLKRRVGQPLALQQQQQLRAAPSASSGIRVTMGSRPLVVNSRGLITVAKGQRHANSTANSHTRPYNPLQLFASSQTSQTLEPIELLPQSPPGKRGQPAKGHKPTVVVRLRQPANTSATTSSTFELLSPMQTSIATGEHAPLTMPSSSYNRTSTTAAATTTTAAATSSANFHHNPPYKQAATTPAFALSTSPPPLAQPVRLNTRFQSGANNQILKNATHSAHNNYGNNNNNRTSTGGTQRRPANGDHAAPYAEHSLGADLLSEPANTLQFHQRPPSGSQTQTQSGNSTAATNPLAHLQQSLATTSLRPTKIRIKLLQSLFGGGGGGGGTKGTPAKATHAQSSTAGGSPAPLLSSTVANNVAALLAQRLSALVRPPSSHHAHLPAPLNSLFGFRVRNAGLPQPQPLGQSFSASAGKLRLPFAGPQPATPNFSINRRTAGVGSLLVSGLIYGLTVLPALMALTGINPLSPGDSNVASASSTSSSTTTSTNRQQQQSGEKRSKSSGSKSQRRPTAAAAAGQTAASNLDSEAFAYLLPLLAPASATPAHVQHSAVSSMDGSEPLGSLTTAEVNSPRAHLANYQNEAQSSALKSLYAPPPTVLESGGGGFGGGVSDLSSLLEDGPPPPSLAPSASQELDWPSSGSFSLSGGRGDLDNYPQRPATGWHNSPHNSDAYPRGGPFARRNRDLAASGWQATGGSDGGDDLAPPPPHRKQSIQTRPSQGHHHTAALSDSPGPFGAQASAVQQPAHQQQQQQQLTSFDDRSAPSGSSLQPQAVSRQRAAAASMATLIQVAPPPPMSQLTQQQQLQQHQSVAVPNNRLLGGATNSPSWSVGSASAAASSSGRAGNQERDYGEDRFRQQVSYLIDAQQQQLRQQHQLASLGDEELAILGPWRPPPPPSSDPSVDRERPAAPMATVGDFGGLRQRRTVAAVGQQQPHFANLTASVAANNQPWAGDKSLVRVSHAHHHHQQQQQRPAPNWASESDWRVITPPASAPRPTFSPPPGRPLDSNARQDDHWATIERTKPPSSSSPVNKSKKNKSKPAKKRRLSGARHQSTTSGGNSNNTTTTSTRAPQSTSDNDDESELLMAHSMAMGSRVLNEQLTGHHQRR